ncbi:MAG: ABC transporter permease subunit, partial [Planctomycetia bacterium]
MNEARGLSYLSWLTFRRQALGRKSLIVVVLVVMACLVTTLWAQRTAERQPDLKEKVRLQRFTDRVVLPVFVGFVLPIVALVYAAAALGEERDERTLVYLLARPLSRYRIYLAKGIGVLPVVLTAALGGFALVCAAGGPPGRLAWTLYWPA